MAGGHTQAIDAAFVEANASMDSLQPKAVPAWQLSPGEAPLEAATEPRQNQPFTAVEANARPNKPARNNTTYRNLADKDARMAQKPDKPCRLYYLASMAVDTHRHVITHMQADFADERDSRHLMPIVDKLSGKLKQSGFGLASFDWRQKDRQI
jgi:hypothetical protein